MWVRNAADLERWLGDWPLVEPGIAYCADWRPDRQLNALEELAKPFGWVAVAQRPL